MIGRTAPPDPHRRSYAELSEAERWDWHARIYAFRRVIMGIDERSSPTDPDGFWFDQPRVDYETRRLLAKRGRIGDERLRDIEASADRYETARLNREAWAADLGYSSFKYMMEIGLVRAVREAPNYVNGSRRQQARNVAVGMGVTAREIVPERDEAALEEPPH